MDLKTQAIVLRRTNYAEADRILQILTRERKISVMAKGVRREKSRLAGGIELFSLSEVLLKRGRGELMVLAGARLEEFWGGIMKDLAAMSLAGKILKDVSRAAEQVDSAEFFNISVQALRALNKIVEQTEEEKPAKFDLVRAWWELNLARVLGNEANFRRDVADKPLMEGQNYVWNSIDEAFEPLAQGEIGTEQIKLLRLMLCCPVTSLLQVKNADKMVNEVLFVAKSIGKHV